MELDILEEIKTRIIDTGRDKKYSIQAYEFFLLSKDILEKTYEKANFTYGGIWAHDFVSAVAVTANIFYGPTAKYVLSKMGISDAKDIGTIVFNLIDLGLLERDFIIGAYENFVEISSKPLFGKIKPKELNIEKLKIFEDT